MAEGPKYPPGELRRPEPVDPYYGFGRGTPVDRLYIETFLGEHRAAIHGRVLEFGDSTYTYRFGRPVGLRADVLFPEPKSGATVIADLNQPGALPRDRYDCILCIQVLQFIRRPVVGVRNLARALRPGGTLLVTAPCLSQCDQYERQRWGEYWRFTAQGLAELLASGFPAAAVHTWARGNVLAATAMLQGLALEEFERAELELDDPRFEVTALGIAVRSE